MLSYMRPAFSEVESEFIEEFIWPLGVEKDEFGNLLIEIGDKNNVMWSCHTDTVHTSQGYQDLFVDTHNNDHVVSNKNCLGADDTSGIWLMTEMIKANKPGLYIFHRAEEIGAKGSMFIADHKSSILNGIDFAIALDRKLENSLVTHQMGSRTASDAFGKSLIEQIPYLKLDDTGMFTDTYSYETLIPECTNISVGYNKQHTPNEYQSISYLLKIRESLLNLDYSKFVVDRDPNDVSNVWNEKLDSSYYDSLYHKFINSDNISKYKKIKDDYYGASQLDEDERLALINQHLDEKEELEEFIKNNPDITAQVLYSYYQIRVEDIIDYLH